MPLSNQEQVEQAKEIYERCVKTLEPDHWGKFVAVARDGELFLGKTTLEALDLAEAQGKTGSFIFKIGEIMVGRCR